MKSIEASAKTRKDAIQQALDELGAELHEVEIEILDEGSKGFLGIGARDVRVKVSVDRTEEERPRRERRPDRDARPGGRSGKREGAPREGGGGKREGRGPRKEREGRPAGERKKRDDDRGPRKRREDRPRGEDRKGPRRDDRPRESSKVQESVPRPRRERPPRENVDVESIRTMGNSAAALLNEVIQKMGIEATVSSRLNDENDIVLGVESPDSAILIGRKGRNLSSMQFLINRMMLNADDSTDSVDRIIVDVEGYLDRRQESLEDMARNLAERAKKSGRAIRVKPLNPQERRIVHLALEGDEDVRTYSHGSALHRRVVIVPTGADENDFDDDDDYADERRRPRDRDRDRDRRGGRPPRAERQAPRREREPSPAEFADSSPAETAEAGSRKPPEDSGQSEPASQRRGRGSARGGQKPAAKPKMPYEVDVEAERERIRRERERVSSEADES